MTDASHPRPASTRAVRWAAGAALVMLLATVGPALLAGLPAGDRSVDAMGSWWFQWWVGRALQAGLPLDHTDLLFFPWGKDILRDTGANLVDAGFAGLLHRLVSPTQAWNLLYLAILASNFTACLLLGGVGWPGRLAAGLAGMLHPYVLWELQEGRPTQAMLGPAIAAVALSSAAFSASASRGALGRAALGGALLGLAGWIYWYAALFAALAIGLLGLQTRAAGRLAVVAGVAAGVAAPLAWPLLSALQTGPLTALLPVEAWLEGSASLQNVAGDRLQLCVLGGPCTAAFLAESGIRPIGVALGWLSWPLAAAAGLAGRRFVAVGLLSLALAVGPFPGGLPNPLYIGLSAILPPLARLYWPCRALLLLVPLGALGAAAVMERLGAARAGIGLGLLLVLLGLDAAATGRWPLPTWQPAVEAAWACLPPNSGGVISLPYGVGHDLLMAQTVHGNPLLGGMNERSRAQAPEEQQALRAENAWLAAVLRAPVDPRDHGAGTEAEKAAVGALGYRWVVVRWASAPAARGGASRAAVERRLSLLLGAPARRGEALSIYAPWGEGALACPADMDLEGRGR